MFIDLSHTIEHGMITYKGLPAPIISDHLSREASKSIYEAGTEFHIGKIAMVANTGTYLDSPFHRYPHGKDLSQLELDSLANLDGVLVRCLTAGSEPGQRGITPDALAGYELKGKAVLFHTGWDRHWRTDKYSDGTHPFLTEETAELLVNEQPALVGIDAFNIDDTSSGRRPAHSLLLAAEIPIVEHLCNLDTLPDTPFRFFAVPVKVKAFGTFPVRAFAIQ
ncbi:MAG TPA: cyclase family protein [Pyrinomonadaceae bacterium]|nr:cyclase family protein [Pyrinomonadaceae bacterium]